MKLRDAFILVCLESLKINFFTSSKPVTDNEPSSLATNSDDQSQRRRLI